MWADERASFNRPATMQDRPPQISVRVDYDTPEQLLRDCSHGRATCVQVTDADSQMSRLQNVTKLDTYALVNDERRDGHSRLGEWAVT